MKHTYLLLVLLLCFCSYSNAQTALPEFAPHGAHWTYESIDKGPTPHDYYLSAMTVSAWDTIIDGKTCRTLAIAPGYAFYAYRDSLQIWIHANTIGQPWQLLYDFGWTVGQSVSIPTSAGYPSSSYTTTTSIVNSVSDTVVNGDTLPMLKLSFPYAPVIMNIGSVDNFFIPQLYFIPEVGYAFVRCYQDTILGTYKAPGVVVCDTNFHVGVPIISSNNDMQIYPNPATNEVRLPNPNGNVATVEIHAIDGRMIKNITAPNNGIPLDGVADGMYVVVMHLRNGDVVTKKLVVQR